jgi:hypothetical protein
MVTGRAVQNLLRLWLKHSDANRFDAATWDPAAAQKDKLLQIIHRNRETVYGREHDFAHIQSVEDFRARVPANSYETLGPYVERMMGGERNVLTADVPLMFATTSGTTGRSKFIPVTPSYLHEYSQGIHIHTYRIFADFRDVLEGRAVVSASSDEEGRTEGGLPYGAISGYLSRTQPDFVRRFYVLPYEICKVKQIEQKYYLTLLYALGADVRYLLTPNPSSLLLLAEKMTVHAEELIHDIRRGSVSPPFLPDNAPPQLTARLHADPARAAELQAILRRTGRLLPAEAWPNLRVVSCWKGGTMPLYLSKLPNWYGDVPIRDLGYMASEGRGATPLVNSGCGGVLSVTSHFFEFVPEEQRDSESPDFLTADELESNHQYFVYFTTSAGLYRYDINDLIRVVDFYHQTPVVQFVRKGGGISSITGEKLTESQVTGALLDVVGRDGYDIDHFTAYVEWGDPPRYAFCVEAGPDLGTETARAFLGAMDAALRAHNEEYETKRDSQRLGHPVLKRVAAGSYLAMKQKRVAAGAPEAQVKIPQLSTDMNFGSQFDVIETVEVVSSAAAV